MMGMLWPLILIRCLLPCNGESKEHTWTTIFSVPAKDNITEGVIPAENTFTELMENTTPTLDLSRIYEFNLNATKRFLATDVTKFLCGTAQRCNHTSPSEKSSCKANCYPCQCDEMCQFYGDCCPDLLLSNSPDIPTSPSPYVSCAKERWTTWGNFTDIFMVSSCPVDADLITAEKCSRPNNGDQDQATPVSVLSSGITYRNVFCAQCHNIPDVQAWRHRAFCRSDKSLNTAKSKLDLWRRVLADKGCKIESYPPNNVTPRQCFHNKVTACPRGLDPEIENLCLSFENKTDLIHNFLSYTEYGNVFCAVCNGEILDKSGQICFPGVFFSGSLPPPLSVLLDFNPIQRRVATSEEGIRSCGVNQVYDPFSVTCKNIACFEGWYLIDEQCKKIPYSGDSIGYLLNVTLEPANASIRIPPIPLFLDEYTAMLHRQLTNIHSFLYTKLNVTFYSNEFYDGDETPLAKAAIIKGKVLVTSHANSTYLEKVLERIISEDFSYNVSGEIITMLSRPCLCLRTYEHGIGQVLTTLSREEFSGGGCVDCRTISRGNCATIPLSCAFVEYGDRLEENFIFDPTTHNLKFRNYSFMLRSDEFRVCGRVLRICLPSFNNMTKIIFTKNTNVFRDEHYTALAIVSLICISSSLAGLLMTFLVYCLLPKLRTLPGKNSMALMFHLFYSHLLFLTTSDRTTNALQCQVFGVLLHYFWMGSFAWMLVSAYHMYTVFTRIRGYVNDDKRDRKLLIVYSIFGIIVPVVDIVCCIVTHVVQSHGKEIGYGGTICFLNSPLAIGLFFVGPLALILLINAIFFTKTIIAIRSVPDMKDASNKSRKHHVYVYFKLSLLFGFTWLFGILAAILQSTVLQYVFTVLTGSQGVMIFAAYSVNRHTRALLKARLSGSAEHSVLRSRNHNTSSTLSTVSLDTPL